jgi:hypothetical protein
LVLSYLLHKFTFFFKLFLIPRLTNVSFISILSNVLATAFFILSVHIRELNYFVMINHGAENIPCV